MEISDCAGTVRLYVSFLLIAFFVRGTS